MGSVDSGPAHTVRISRGFWMGKCEVTQAEYETITGEDPSTLKGARNPVECVFWDDAVAFCTKLTQRERKAARLPEGYEYRLPTEAEWEYAARGGAQSAGTTYSGSSNVDEVAWYKDNSGGKTHPVGLKEPNELGLYDLSGNVAEWCLDWYDEGYYARSPNTDPANTQAASFRVFRGDCWTNDAGLVRSVVRGRFRPDDAGNGLGFRACLAPAIPAAP